MRVWCWAKAGLRWSERARTPATEAKSLDCRAAVPLSLLDPASLGLLSPSGLLEAPVKLWP
jgi:hypothetical protein